MYEIETFLVEKRLVLRKTPFERLKTIIKSTALLFGVDIRGWRELKTVWESRANKKEYEMQEGELDDEHIREISSYARKRVADYANVIAPVSQADLVKTVQYTTVPLLEKLIAVDGSIRSVVDIGCYYVRVLSLLARKHQSVRWHFVDFMDNITEINEPFAGPNTRFVADYPLRALRSAKPPYDIAHFNRVFALTGKDEIRLYLDALREKARYIVFGEPAKLIGLPGNFSPDDYDDYFQFPGYRTYNYRKLISEFGFELLHYDAVRTSQQFSGEQHFMIRGIAKNPDFA